MSKHNHNSALTASLRCRCGRYGTIAEYYSGHFVFGYVCPNCAAPHLGPQSLTAEEYYKQFKR